jgi:hypothetical protein
MISRDDDDEDEDDPRLGPERPGGEYTKGLIT